MSQTMRNPAAADEHVVSFTLNGKRYEDVPVDARLLLSDFVREDLGLTGTHVGCEQGACGACTVLINGRTVRSCLAFAVQINGQDVTTIEGITDDDELTELQEAFNQHHGLQCGFCTPGMVLAAQELLDRYPNASEYQIRKKMSGNICRCTGYAGIVRAIQACQPTDSTE